jgi:hypothetical protein
MTPEDKYIIPMVRCGCLVSGGVTLVDLEQVPGLTPSHRAKLEEWFNDPTDGEAYDKGRTTGYFEGYHEGYSERGLDDQGYVDD